MSDLVSKHSSSHDCSLLILTDATASMRQYLAALRQALPDIIRMSALTGCFARIGVLAYRDYCCPGRVTEWSGWYHVVTTASNKDESGSITKESLIAFAETLTAFTGNQCDFPEATKTGLAHSYHVIQDTDNAVILLFADAPPHMKRSGGVNHAREEKALLEDGAFSGSGHLFCNWLLGSKTIAQKAQIFALIQSSKPTTLAIYSLLTTKTNGACFKVSSSWDAQDIASAAIGTLLAWMGVEKECIEQATSQIVDVVSFRYDETLAKLDSENKAIACLERVHRSLEYASIPLEELKYNVPQMIATGGNAAVLDFSKRYLADLAYKNLVVEQLADIIEYNVTAIATNPVFGSLWRAVCNDRLNDARDGLVNAFSVQVGKIKDDETKKRMTLWLEESYNCTSEILEMIEGVELQDRYPCVFLDPTNTYDKHSDDANASHHSSFTRIELLEIGRSCDPRVLKRLGRVLTHLTYVDSEANLPDHIRNAPEADIPRIPMALVLPKYKRNFWKILLHTVVPGTLISARVAALLAALSLRMGMSPLRDAADTELLNQCDKWNSLEIPETWNASCLSLILDAHNDYEMRIREGVTVRHHADARFLLDDDQKLFQTLLNYRMLESNLSTSLTARIGWHPDKTKIPVGPLVQCTLCRFPRSVTIMGTNGICGVCLRYDPTEEGQELRANVTAKDNNGTKIAWVECSMTYCRAQYVVYNPDRLNVRAKCYYCRKQRIKSKALSYYFQTRVEGSAPVVECSLCLNRVIWPAKYRPSDWHPESFKCPSCEAGHQTIVDETTTAKELIKENGLAWLLRNDDQKIAEPFNGRSLFSTIATAGTESFVDKVEVLPDGGTPSLLTIRGKPVHNSAQVFKSLQMWVLSRRAELGVCSLCFMDYNKRDLRLACGRSGCASKVCQQCFSDWYGLNGRGRIINISALSCPFCRRRPIPKTIQSFGLHAVGDLRLAVEESGSWVYAWCVSCTFAKRLVERVCAAGAPVDVRGWQCEQCTEGVAAANNDDTIPPRLQVKPCPGCGTLTQKAGGCGHMSCAVPGCNTHWCWYCGNWVALELIYKHMDDEHGGWYGNGDDDGSDEEEDEWY